MEMFIAVDDDVIQLEKTINFDVDAQEAFTKNNRKIKIERTT